MQTMILTSQDQLKNLDNVGAVLIYPSKITTSGLIQSALSNDLVVNCIVDEDPDNAFVGKSLSALGYPTGCYIVINYQNKKDVKDITGAFSNNLQLGYRAAIIVNKSDYTQDELKDLQQYGIVVIDHKDIKDSLLNVPNFLKTRSVAMMRDYTNVDISGVGPGAFVGVGKDTSGLGGGRSFGYSTNGQDFYAVITPKGLVFRQIDALRMWRLLKPQQAAQIGDFFNNKVAKEIEAQNESLKSAMATANSAVNAANQAVNDSKVNSDAINAMKSAESEARADADKALSDAQAAIKNVSSNVDAVWKNIASVEGQVNSAQTANEATAQQLQSDIDNAKQSVADTNKSLDNVSASLDTYAKSATEQGKDITELKNQQGKLEADLAGANGNVTQLQATVSGIQGNLKETNDNVASLSATASQAGVALQNAQSQVAQVIARADTLQATLAEQDKKIVAVKATADGASIAASSANSTATEAKLTASAASVTASDAKSEVLTVTATASDAKVLATNANSQALEASAAASGVSINLSGVEKKANDAASQASVATSNASQAQATADSNANKINSVSNTVTTVQASIQATQKELSGKVDQATIDSTNKKLEDINAQVSVVAGEVRSKAEQTTVNGIATDLNGIKNQVEWKVVSGPFDANNYKTATQIVYRDMQARNTPNPGWFYFTVEGTGDRVKQTLMRDNAVDTWVRYWNGSWSGWTKQATSNDVANLQAQVNKYSTEISNNTREIQLKASAQLVDTINQTVQQQQAQQQVLADQIKTKVTSSDVKGILADGKYATQDYTQTLVNQTSRTLSANITEVQRNVDSNHQADVNRMTNLQASIDGLQSTVRNNATSTQNQITQLADVTKSEIKTAIDNNTPAKSMGGDVDLNKIMPDGKYLLTGQLTNSPYSDKVTSPGKVYLVVSSNGQNQVIYDDADKKYYSRSYENVYVGKTPEGFPSYRTQWTDWTEGTDSTQITQMQNAINLRVQQGDLISQINLAAGQTLIQSDKIYLDAGTVAFSGKAFIPSAAIASLEADKITTGTLNGVHIHQIANANGRSIDIANGNISLNSSDPYEPRITFNYQGKETKMFNAVGDLEADSFSIFNFAPSDTSSLHPITYFSIANTGGSGSGNASMHLDHAIIDGHEWWASADGITFGRSYDGQNTSSTYVDLYAKSFDPHSQLSSKTRIERLDGQKALDTIMADDMYTYQYKSDVVSGSTKRYASLIIDDVNDIKRYRAPDIFIADNGKCRDDGTQLAYLIAAFQYQHQIINDLTEKVNQLEEKING